MDCIEAQRVISETLDRAPVDATMLESAKTHCRACEQCGAYVRALNAIRRAPLPDPPSDLPDRIMAAVRAETIAAEQQAADLSEQAAANVAEDEPVAEDAPVESAEKAEPSLVSFIQSATTRLSVGRSPNDQRMIIAWGSAAAVLLVLVSVGGALGILRLVNGGSNVESSQAPPAAPLQVDASKSAWSDNSAPRGAAAPQAESAPLAAESYLVVSARAYVNAGAAADVERSGLRSIGQAQVALQPGTSATAVTVLAGSEPGVVYVEGDAGGLLHFTEVTRSYKNVIYRLQSAGITSYRGWPTIPAGIPRPEPENSADGSPAFALDGTDDTGTPVYHRVGSDWRLGIAIPPNTPSPDPAAGNPNWTWWTP